MGSSLRENYRDCRPLANVLERGKAIVSRILPFLEAFRIRFIFFCAKEYRSLWLSGLRALATRICNGEHIATCCDLIAPKLFCSPVVCFLTF